MANRSVELTLASYEAFLSGDLDRWVALYHPECEWDVSRYDGWDGTATYRGRDGLRRFHAEWTAAFEDLHVEPEQLIELEGERVLVVARRRARRLPDGEVFEQRFAQIGELDGPWISDVRLYSDAHAAMRDAGVA
jgi:ketosteroid isomerase-like protein